MWELIGAFLLILTCCISFLEEKCFPERALAASGLEAGESEKLLKEEAAPMTEPKTAHDAKCSSDEPLNVIDMGSSETRSLLKGLSKGINVVLAGVGIGHGSDVEEDESEDGADGNGSHSIGVSSSVHYGSVN